MSRDLQSLAEAHFADPTERNREYVVLAAQPLVRSLISKLNVPDDLMAAREDLENVGMLGLLQALQGYNPERGTPFISYAYGRVRGALVDYLRSIDTLPRERRRRLAEAHQATEDLRQINGVEPSPQDVADYMGVSIKKYHKIMMDGQHRYALSLHDTVDNEGEGAILEVIPNESAMEGFEAVEMDSLHAYIAKLVTHLPEREQNILALYYYENLTLCEIAEVMNLTGARISQILSKIHRTLRERLHATQAYAA
ncbi:MAG: sigma-70 family RNA polymerase sigma factor [Bacteroidota bacterium]